MEMPILGKEMVVFGLTICDALAMKEMYRSVDRAGGESMTVATARMPGSIVVGFIYY